MGRKKLELAYISNDTVRKATFNSRHEVLIKKLEDLKLICGVDACAIIYNGFDSTPEVWPSHSGAKEVIEKFVTLTETERSFKSVTHEEFINQEITKVRNKRQQLAEENKEGYLNELMFKCLSGNMRDLSLKDDDNPELCSFIDKYVKKLTQYKNKTLNTPHFEIGESSSTSMAEAGQEHVNSLVSNHVDVPTSNSPQVTSEMQLVISSDQTLAHDTSVASSDQEVYVPVMNQDEFYNMDQNQNEQEGFVEEMLKLGEQTGFPWMEEDNQF